MNPSEVTIKEKLDSMPLEEFEKLLARCADNSKEKTSEHAEIISQLKHQTKVQQAEESIPNLTNTKHSSSLQSLVHKDRAKNHHKVPVGGGISYRPGDYYQQNQTTTCTATTTVIPTVVIPFNSPVTTNNLPAQYYFNCATKDGYQLPNIQSRNFETDGDYRASPESQIKHSTTLYDAPEDPEVNRTKSNLQLSESYASVSSVTAATSGQSSLTYGSPADRYYKDTSTVPEFKSHKPITAIAPSTLASPPLVQHTNLTYSNSQQQALQSYPATLSSPSVSAGKALSDSGKKPGKKNKGNKPLRETSYAPVTIPGFRGNENLDKLVQFVEGKTVGKRGNKKKEREGRGKSNGNELVKSMSLDDDNLSLAAKKTGDKTDRVSTLKESAPKQDRSRVDKDKSVKDLGKGTVSQGSQKSAGSPSNSKESDVEDSKSPARNQSSDKFTVVIRKRKNKTACATSPPGSAVGKEPDNRKEVRRSRSRGERRKSVGSVPGSDHSEGSDDGSVRSLPAGECTKRETIPKSCSSSGGTPQTSYADIARLTKDEEAKKELTQALEDYPSLHGSDNSDGSDDGSDRSVPVGEVTSKEVAQKSSSNGSTPLTSYADIARLASHEDKKDDKKDQPAEDFPELSSTVTGSTQDCPNDILPIPKSDLNVPSSKFETTESAFPQLVAPSAPKPTSQGPAVVKTMSTVVSAGSPTGSPKVSTSSVSVTTPARAPTPTQKAHISSTSPSPTIPCANMNSTNYVPGNTGFGSHPNKANNPPARIPNSQVNSSVNSLPVPVTGSKVKPLPYRDGKNLPKEVTTVSINGHLSDNEKDNVIKKSDIPGAKTDKSAFSVTVPQQFVIDSGTGECTEAVVFCGENFKEPPQLPSKELEFEFGFNVNEYVNMSKTVPSDSSDPKNSSLKKQSKGARDEIQKHNVDKCKPLVVTETNEIKDIKKSQAPSVNQIQESRASPRNAELPSKPDKIFVSNSEKPQTNKPGQNKPHHPRKSVPANQASEGAQSLAAPVSQSVEGYSNTNIVTAYPLTPINPSIPVHINSGMPPMYGVPDFVPPPSTYQTTGIPCHIPVSEVVQMPRQASYECSSSQYASPVYPRASPAPVASASAHDDLNFVAGSAPVQSQNVVPTTISSDYTSNTPNVAAPCAARQSQTTVPGHTGQIEFPDRNIPQSTDSKAAAVVGQGSANVNNVHGLFGSPNIILECYVTPDPSPYNNANVEEMRNYLIRRERECERLREKSSRIRQIT